LGEYEKITNRDFAKAIFDLLRMSHEGNELVKETKALALIQKYDSFKMEENENIEEMFSRFQTLVAGLRSNYVITLFLGELWLILFNRSN
jgi:hypothetical protein